MRWRCPRFRSKKQLSCHCCLSHWESNKYEKCYASTMHLVGSECVFLSPLSMLKFAYASAVAISLWVTDATVYIKCVYPRLGLHQDKLRILCMQKCAVDSLLIKLRHMPGDRRFFGVKSLFSCVFTKIGEYLAKVTSKSVVVSCTWRAWPTHC